MQKVKIATQYEGPLAMGANVPELVLWKMKRAMQSGKGNKRICLVKRWMEYSE